MVDELDRRRPIRALKQSVRGKMVALSGPLYWAYRRWRRGFEEPELAVLPALCDPERIAVDVGANYGMYTSELRRHARRCVAFEPLPSLARMLRRGFGDVEVHQIALSDHEGTAELRSPRLYSGYSTMESENPMHAPTRAIEVVSTPVRRLDDLALDAIGVIKVDVEGHEESVIAGATETLGRDMPNLVLELEERHKEGCIERTDARLRELGYAGLFLERGRVCGLDATKMAARQRDEDPKTYVRNFIFVHESALEHTRGAMQARIA